MQFVFGRGSFIQGERPCSAINLSSCNDLFLSFCGARLSMQCLLQARCVKQRSGVKGGRMKQQAPQRGKQNGWRRRWNNGADRMHFKFLVFCTQLYLVS